MSSVLRDVNVWVRRARECRNPLLWMSALNYDRQRYRLLSAAARRPVSVIADYLREIEDDSDFITEVRDRLARWTAYEPRAVDFMMSGRSGSVFFNEVTLYAMVRAAHPEIVIETGGTPGKSTAFILRAMEHNGAGHLYTIDLPPQTVDQQTLKQHKTWHQAMPKGATSGWVVPERLRQRHTLLSGKSSVHLPPLLAKLDSVDMFFHDSDHSYENMMWEFETAWPKVGVNGGLLISDDILANRSFDDFCQKAGLHKASVFNLGVARA